MSSVEAQPLLLFNPFDPTFRINPYPTYQRLRTEAPVYRGMFDLWVLSRYDDCLRVLRDARHWSSDERNSLLNQQPQQTGKDPQDDFFLGARPFLFLDPPDHTRLRGLVQKAFTPRVVETLRPRIQAIVDEILDRAAESGSMDVIEDLAYPLPVNVICEMMGVPAQDHAMFREWSRELVRGLDPEEVLPPEVAQRRAEAVQSFGEYFKGLAEERRKQPKDDLLSALLAAEEAGDKLTEVELLATCVLILVAGHETTVNLIGNGVLALLRHPDQAEKLRADPSLARPAVDEFLRYDPPVQMTIRVALEEMQIDGHTVAKGEGAVLLLGSANRDPARFPDPDRLDITRGDDRHLAFGFGPHFCLGAELARTEGEIAIGTLVRRFPALRGETDAPPYKENIVIRGLASLSVTLG